jgi:fatty acid desaturase
LHRSPTSRTPLDVGEQKENVMLWTIAMVLAVLWLLGMVSAYTMGGFVHILLILAVAVILINVIQGRRLA